jgi:23S rRNA (adenine2503-C2)-methyltransferase
VHKVNTSLKLLDEASESPPLSLPSLLGTPIDELEDACVKRGEPTYRGRQIFQGVFQKRSTDFNDLSAIPKILRHKLAEEFSLQRPTVTSRQISQDGTRKYQMAGCDGALFESVYIPSVARSGKTNTLCVSSQTGCAVGCRFCYTASLKRNRNLAADEIVGQVLAVQSDVESLGQQAKVTNIVFMGMGEPLLNYPEVIRSIHILTHALGPNFSKRRVTVSTAGIVPRIYELGRDVDTQLAISLNATTNQVRDEIMPINKKWPIEDLIQAMRDYPLKPRRRITVEYVLLNEINDTTQDAHRLVKLLENIRVKVNVLPLNSHDRTPYDTPPPARVESFMAVLRNKGLNVIARTPRGRDISAACGQLGEIGATV